MREQRAVCPGCGTRAEEWDRDPDAYIGDYRICPGCERMEQERGNVPEGAKGVHFHLLPREVALAKALTLED